MCDVDTKKISQGFYDHYDDINRKMIRRIPVIHFSQAKPPVIICMKLDLTQGEFEKNLESMNWKEGVDFFHFG